MNLFSYDIEVAEMEAEINGQEWSVEKVFGSSPIEANRRNGMSKEAEHRRNWRPKREGEVPVESRRSYLRSSGKKS